MGIFPPAAEVMALSDKRVWPDSGRSWMITRYEVALWHLENLP